MQGNQPGPKRNASATGGDRRGSTLRLDKATTRRLAVKADCDPRTITKALHGEPIKGMSGQRARAVLAEIGIVALPRPTGVDSSGGQP